MDNSHKLLLEFKASVLVKHEWAVASAEGEIERGVKQRKLDYMRELLNYLIPESDNDRA
jgi:hypothetical protein